MTPAGDRGLEPGHGVDRRRPEGEGVDARELDDGADAATLDVEGVGVLPLLGQHEAAEEAQGRFVEGGGLGQVCEEQARLGGPGQDAVVQLGEEPGVPMHRSHVEEDARLEDRVGHGLGEPGRELLAASHCRRSRQRGLVAMTSPGQGG
jgi:hypothetical protein